MLSQFISPAVAVELKGAKACRHSSSHQRISQKNQTMARQLSIPALFNENLYNRIRRNVWPDKK